MSEVTVGLYGKHPSFGDFIAAGLSDAARATLETWLKAVLPALRDSWQSDWEPLFDASPTINFWIGAAISGTNGPICGIMMASRDRVGRRFPLIAAVSGAQVHPPVQASQPAIYDTLLAAVQGYQREAGTDASSFAAALEARVLPLMLSPAEPIQPDFWAARGDGDLARLWADVAPVDHARAAAGRSYLWCQGRGGAAVHVTRDLPGPTVLGWLMTDAVRGTPVPPDDPAPARAAAADDAERTLPPVTDDNRTARVRPEEGATDADRILPV